MMCREDGSVEKCWYISMRTKVQILRTNSRVKRHMPHWWAMGQRQENSETIISLAKLPSSGFRVGKNYILSSFRVLFVCLFKKLLIICCCLYYTFTIKTTFQLGVVAYACNPQHLRSEGETYSRFVFGRTNLRYMKPCFRQAKQNKIVVSKPRKWK